MLFRSDTDSADGMWPRVVFLGDPRWSVSALPSQVSCFRRSSTISSGDYDAIFDGNAFSSGANVFEFTADDISSELTAYPSRYLVSASERTLAYDANTGKLLPQSYYPTVAQSLGSAKAMALGADLGFAVLANDTVYSWGIDFNEQRAQADALSTTWKQFAVSRTWSLGLKADGTVVYLGPSSNTSLQPPSGLGSCIWVAAAESTAAAIKSDGTVVVWGSSAHNLLNVPSDLGLCSQIAAGQYNFIALRTDGRIRVWGDNTYGQLSIPNAVNTGALVSKVVSANSTFAVLKASGVVNVWGDAHGTDALTTLPPALASNTVLDIGACSYNFVAVLSSGALLSWGKNDSENGNLVTGTTAALGFVRVGSGWSSMHALAVTSSGSYAWGASEAANASAVANSLLPIRQSGTVSDRL